MPAQGPWVSVGFDCFPHFPVVFAWFSAGFRLSVSVGVDLRTETFLHPGTTTMEHPGSNSYSLVDLDTGRRHVPWSPVFGPFT